MELSESLDSDSISSQVEPLPIDNIYPLLDDYPPLNPLFDWSYNSDGNIVYPDGFDGGDHLELPINRISEPILLFHNLGMETQPFVKWESILPLPGSDVFMRDDSFGDKIHIYELGSATAYKFCTFELDRDPTEYYRRGWMITECEDASGTIFYFIIIIFNEQHCPSCDENSTTQYCIRYSDNQDHIRNYEPMDDFEYRMSLMDRYDEDEPDIIFEPNHNIEWTEVIRS